MNFPRFPNPCSRYWVSREPLFWLCVHALLSWAVRISGSAVQSRFRILLGAIPGGEWALFMFIYKYCIQVNGIKEHVSAIHIDCMCVLHTSAALGYQLFNLTSIAASLRSNPPSVFSRISSHTVFAFQTGRKKSPNALAPLLSGIFCMGLWWFNSESSFYTRPGIAWTQNLRAPS